MADPLRETTIAPPVGTVAGTTHWLNANGRITWALWDGEGWRLSLGGKDTGGRVAVGPRLLTDRLLAHGWTYRDQAHLTPIEWSGPDA